MLAALSGRDDIIKVLIEYGADVDMGGTDGYTALHFAAYKSQLQACVQLVEMGNANVNAENSMGRTPLQFLEQMASHVWNQNTDGVARYLRENGGH